MGIPEALISSLGNLISALADLVTAMSAISGNTFKMGFKPEKLHRALGRTDPPHPEFVDRNRIRESGTSKDTWNEGDIYDNPDIGLTVPELIQKYGFPLETHQVVTKDNYILTVFRIPHGRKGKSNVKKPPVLLVHGLLNSAGAWIMHHPDKALAYKLADEGFDCWIPNLRGSTYSKAHKTLSPTDKQFWDFSFHEMGIYDVPAILNYVLEKTAQPSLYYIGHSLGNNVLMIAMSDNPKINEQIKLFVSLAPAAYLYMTTAKVLTFHAPFFMKQKTALDFLTGNGELMPRSFVQNLKSAFVPKSVYFACKCVTASMYTMGGYNPDQLYWPYLPVIAGHTPSSTSVRTYIHCLQYFNTSHFQMYDHGSREANMDVYGKSTPPKYDLNSVTAKVAIFWGPNDLLCRPETVGRLASELPNVIASYRVACEKFSHTDFLYAKDVDKLVYETIIDLLNMSSD